MLTYYPGREHICHVDVPRTSGIRPSRRPPQSTPRAVIGRLVGVAAPIGIQTQVWNRRGGFLEPERFATDAFDPIRVDEIRDEGGRRLPDGAVPRGPSCNADRAVDDYLSRTPLGCVFQVTGDSLDEPIHVAVKVGVRTHRKAVPIRKRAQRRR